MKLKRLKKSKKGKIEIIPMIDVMFFLLATFMLASLSMQKINSLPINLPEGKAEPSNISKQITITINQDNEIFLDKKLTDLESLALEVDSAIKSGASNTIIIASDKKAEGGIMVESMLKAREGGAKHFSIMVKEK